MPKSGENIRKRTDGRWEARYRKGRRPDGSIIYGSVYAKTYREVKAKLLAAVCTNSETARPDSEYGSGHEQTFGQILLMWLEQNGIGYKGSTLRKYRYLIEKHVLPELGHINAAELTAAAVNAFLSEKIADGRRDRAGRLSGSYVRGMMLIINSALKFAEESGLCAPLKGSVYRPPDKKRELSILNRAEQEKLEFYISSQPDPAGLGILLSLYAGMRIGEICALNWNDVDFKSGIIRVRHTVLRIDAADREKSEGDKSELILGAPKTRNSAREIPISTALRNILYGAESRRRDYYVVSAMRSFLSPRTFEYRFHRVLEKCGVKRINFHALRHTFATRCIEAGVDVKSLSEILGHADVKTTLNTYVHSSMEMKRMQLEKMSKFINRL